MQPAALSVLEGEHFRVIVFVGAKQSKVTFDIAASLQRLGPNASYIKIAGNGSNALDFHVTCYIGQIAAADPGAYFHIISKDSGFDPLIAHLKTKKILACRSGDIADMPIIKAANAGSSAERIAAIVANLKQRGASKPRTVKTLSSTINSIFASTLAEEEPDLLIGLMEKKGLISLSGTKISYSLPE